MKRKTEDLQKILYWSIAAIISSLMWVGIYQTILWGVKL